MAMKQRFLPVVLLILAGVTIQGIYGATGCRTEGSIRLVGGSSEFEGRLEICLAHESVPVWGTVCDDGWTIQSTKVVCRQIQNQTGHEIQRALTFYVSTEVNQANASQPIVLDDVYCTGSEESLLSCDYSEKNNCDHLEDVSVTCVPTDFSLLQRQVAVEGTGTKYNETSICSNSSSSEPELSTESVEGCILYLSGNSVSQNLCNVYYTIGISTVFISMERAVNYPDIQNNIFSAINEIFDPLPPPCRETIVRMICYYYFPPCGNITHFIQPQSVCASTCTNITEVLCAEEWNTVLNELTVRDLITLAERFNAHIINCAEPDFPFDEAPQCCSNIGLDLNASYNMMTEIASENGPVFQIIVPAVILVITVLILGVGTVLFIVCRVRRQRHKPVSYNNHNDTQLKRRPENASGHELTDAKPSDRNPYQDYGGSDVHPPLVATSGVAEPHVIKVSSDFLQEMSDAKLIIPKRHVSLKQCVGQGEFGIVYKAYLCGWERKDSIVAVKTLRAMFTPKDISDLTKESLKMKSFNHPNVLNLMGVCIDAGEAPCIVMPYMANGSLLAYLKKERPNLNVAEEATEDGVITVQKRLLSICLQIAKGMEYLASQRFVHRDLAARNCMIDGDFVIKVADFGLSEDVYSRNYFRQGKVKDESESDVKLPMKWMAIESMMDGIFNEKTDVWSYGVTYWEVFSLGRTPYPAVDPFTLIKHLEGGGRLDKPSNAACSDEIFDVMMSCWFDQPHSRPHFSDLVITVNSLLENLAGYVDFSKFQTQQHQGNDST